MYGQMKALTQLRQAEPVWQQLAVHPGRGVWQRIDRGMHAFFRRVRKGEAPGFPRFKPWQRLQCLAGAPPRPGRVKRRGRYWRVTLKGVPALTMRPSREVPDRQPLQALRSVRRPTGCPVDLGYAVETEPVPSPLSSVGIDLGVRERMTLSTGETIPPLKRATERKQALEARQYVQPEDIPPELTQRSKQQADKRDAPMDKQISYCSYPCPGFRFGSVRI